MTSKNSYFRISWRPGDPPRLFPWSRAPFWLSLVHWGHSGTPVLTSFCMEIFWKIVTFSGGFPPPCVGTRLGRPPLSMAHAQIHEGYPPHGNTW